MYKEIEMQSRLFDNDRVVEQLHWGGGTPTFISYDQITELMDVTRKCFSLRENDQGEYAIEIDPREVDTDTIRGDESNKGVNLRYPYFYLAPIFRSSRY